MAVSGARPAVGDVLVVGGGASGLVAAIAARRAGASVRLLEKNPRPGRKLLTTGNHQCNLTNTHIRKTHYHGDPDFAMRVIGRFDQDRTLDFFRELGLETIADARGRVFPRSYQAGSVLDVLRFELERLGVESVPLADGSAIRPAGNRFSLVCTDGRSFDGRRVILCAGGKAAPATGSNGSGFYLAGALGHRIIELFPALVQLKLDGALHKAMEGMRWEAEVTLVLDDARGGRVLDDILFMTYGVSGPAILNASRAAVEALRRGKRVEIEVNLLPESGAGEVEDALRRRIRTRPERAIGEFFTGWINKRIGQTLVKSLDLEAHRRWAALSEEEIGRLCGAVRGWRFGVTGDTGWPNAQVTAGGVDTAEVDPETLESRLVPGLHFAGEILNVDGDSGGYNLQWAWSSGWTAGSAAAGSRREPI